MRILHVIGTLDPQSGGPAAAVVSLSRFSAPGTLNEVVTLDDPRAPFLSKVGLTVTALGPTWTTYGFNMRLIRWLRANGDRFDGIVLHGLWQYCGYAVWRAFGGSKPYMVFTHGMLDPYFKRAFPFKHAKKWVYWILIEYWVLRGACRVLFTCEEEGRLAEQSFWLHRWTGHIASLGASIPAGDYSARRAAFLERFPKLRGRRYLVFLSRIDRKKGCDLLVAAFIRAAALDPDLNLVMAGPDERNWREELDLPVAAAGLQARVHWTGMLDGDEKWGAFYCAEAFILPSHQENFGIAVAEAMACGKAVLLSDKVNIAANIAAAGAGLVEADTEEGTYRLLAAWIAMPESERRAMGDAARRLFEQSYDMRNLSRDLGNLFDDAIQSQLSQGSAPASTAK